MIPTGKSSSGSLTLEPVLNAMSYSTLAEHCMGEICNYRRGESSDDRYGLELFRRATLENDQDAWIWLEYCFSDLVRSWLHRHPKRDLACRLDSDENYISLAFERLWQAALDQKIAFSRLSAALEYLRMCLNGAILDTLRTHIRSRHIPFPEPINMGEPIVEDHEYGSELWERLQTLFSDEQDKRLIYLLFHCNLKPRDIVRYCTNEYSDVSKIYRLRHNIVDRLMRNADLLRWWLKADEDGNGH